MGIFDRMGRVISSNVNALLDKAEDPKKSVDLIIDEMKEQIRAAKKELIDGIAAEKVLRRKVDELDQDVEKWEKRAELALRSEDESLAREALLHKKRVVADRDRAEALRAEQRSAVLNMKSEMDRMEAKQKELESKRSAMVSKLEQAKSEDEAFSGAGATGGAFAEFRRMEEKIDGHAAEADAHREVEDALRDGKMSDGDLESRFARLERGETDEGGERKGGKEIDDELAALKKKIRIGT